MAYISAKEVAAIRKELKKTFPKFKFGVRKSTGGHRVDVTIKKGPTDFSDICRGDVYAQINPYHTGKYGEHSKFFTKIIEIMKTAPAKVGMGEWYDNSDAMTDYFDVAYYLSLNVGNFQKPYEIS